MERTARIAAGLLAFAAATSARAAGVPKPEPHAKETPVAETRTITVRTDRVVHPRFRGVGFHVFYHLHPTTRAHVEQVLAKRWRELRPSFARVTDQWDWDRRALDRAAEYMLRWKATGTELYVTTWNPKDTKGGAERAAYARKVVDNLEYLIRTKHVTNLKWYCMTNELSLREWGVLHKDLPKFRDYHRRIHDELKARKLDIGLLATDASPIGRWNTIEWATRNMDDITAIYGGHHYINRRPPSDPKFYAWFLSKMKWGAGLARKMGKDFVLGEFGCKQDGRVRDGVRMDACIYWNTPTEPLVGIQLAEAALAAINGGVCALANWTFTDFPDTYSRSYRNKWGTFKWSGADYSTRPHYYAYGLLTRFFRGPATAFETAASDELLRAAAVRHHDGKTWSIAAVNRSDAAAPVRIVLAGEQGKRTFRKYVYDPADVPRHPFGDLQPPVGTVSMEGGELADRVGAGTLTVYTTAYDDEPPARVRGLEVRRGEGGELRLSWRANREGDLCYYRVYRSAEADFAPGPRTRIGSTVATEFVDEAAGAGEKHHYKVLAVDQSGNAGRP